MWSCHQYLSDEHLLSIRDEQRVLHIERASYAVSMSELNTFGARLKARMDELGWSMPRLGKGMKAKKGGILDGDIGRAAVFGWINGAGFPNVIQLAELCKRLDISADYLLFGSRNSTSPMVELAKNTLAQLSQRELDELQGFFPPPSHENLRPEDVPRENTHENARSQIDTEADTSKEVRLWVTKEKDGQSGRIDRVEKPQGGAQR